MKCTSDQTLMIEIDMKADDLQLIKKKVAFTDMRNGMIPFKVFACPKCGNVEIKIDPKDIEDQIEGKEN